ncbi:dihydroorotase [soil metagenome]
MKVLIRSASIVCPSSPLHGQVTDLLIENGIILKIANEINEEADKVISVKGLHVSPGWADMFADFCDPGFEFKETLVTGANAAAAGGFTKVAVVPNTKPVIDNKSQVEYIIERSKNLPVTVLPLGAVTKNTEGKELSEMYDMQNSGAVAFSDGSSSIQPSGILLKALQYIKPFDGVLIQLPEDKRISQQGLMNEGIASTRLGLPGIPAIAEEIQISRDIELVKYTGSKIHFTGISTKRSVELINKAKQEGLQVTCSVTPYHLFFYEDDLLHYDTNLKVNPPLRTKEDRVALREGLKNGIIDCIASHHQPQDRDCKTCEFEYAKPGMITLESLFSIVRSCGVSAAEFVTMQTEHIYPILNLPLPVLDEGAVANLTLFLPDEEYLFDETCIRSKSKNSPFIGKSLKGKVIGIINGDKLFLN